MAEIANNVIKVKNSRQSITLNSLPDNSKYTDISNFFSNDVNDIYGDETNIEINDIIVPFAIWTYADEADVTTSSVTQRLKAVGDFTISIPTMVDDKTTSESIDYKVQCPFFATRELTDDEFSGVEATNVKFKLIPPSGIDLIHSIINNDGMMFSTDFIEVLARVITNETYLNVDE